MQAGENMSGQNSIRAMRLTDRGQTGFAAAAKALS
jgi:hypothetical protein